MSLRRYLPFSLLAAALLAAMSGVAFAAPGGGRGAAPPPPVDRGNDSRPRDDDGLSNSVRRVERSTRGQQVLSAERVPFDGRDVNRIKTVDDHGRVRVFMDDPRSTQPPPEPPAN